MKKAISLLLAIVTVCSLFAIPSLAATTAFDKLTTSKYAKVYTLSASGRTTPYTNKKLNTRGTESYGESSSSYIANSTDELYLMDVGKTNGTWWAYVQYPSGSKRVKAYIPLSAITSNNGSHAKGVSSGKFYCSLRAGTSNSSSYYVASGDEVYLIATSGSKYQIMYPVGNKWRIAWCNSSDYNRYVAEGGESKQEAGTLLFPLKGSITRSSSVKTDGYYCDYRTGGNKAVYAPADGTVVYKQAYREGKNGTRKLSSYGNYIEFTSSDGMYKVKCCHLSSFYGVNTEIKESLPYKCSGSDGTLRLKTKTVKQGDLLGYTGETGNASGPHLHLEVDKKINNTYVSVDPKSTFTTW